MYLYINVLRVHVLKFFIENEEFDQPVVAPNKRPKINQREQEVIQMLHFIVFLTKQRYIRNNGYKNQSRSSSLLQTTCYCSKKLNTKTVKPLKIRRGEDDDGGDEDGGGA